MSDDPQGMAESLDDDIVDDVEDLTGDEYGEGLPSYPPERPVGVETFGVTAVEEDAGESFAERTAHEIPDRPTADDDSTHVGQIVEPHASTLDTEEELLADEASPARSTSAEEDAMHIERER